MMRRNILIIVIAIIGNSCNYKLFADKKMIVHSAKGYVLTFKGDKIFFPFNGIGENAFLDKSKSLGYRLYDEQRFGFVDSMAKPVAVVVPMDINGKRVAVTDTIGLLPVVVKYYLGDNFRNPSQVLRLLFIRNNKEKFLRYKLYDDRQIIILSLNKDAQ